MRQVLRAAIKAAHERIAVVCGAWHAPVLVPAGFPPAQPDADLLKGLPKVKVAATWVPWTTARLASAAATAPASLARLVPAPLRPPGRPDPTL